MPPYNVFNLNLKLLNSSFAKVARFLRSAALGRLGFTLAEFERLMNDLGSGERLCTALEERAKTMNVSLGDVRGHVTSLKDQSERACHAHLEWQPPEVYTTRLYVSQLVAC